MTRPLPSEKDIGHMLGKPRESMVEKVRTDAYKIAAIKFELDSALDVLIRRIKGEADLASAKKWLGLNYPEKFKAAFPGEARPPRKGSHNV